MTVTRRSLLPAALLGLSPAVRAQSLSVLTEASTLSHVRDGKLQGEATEAVEAVLRLAGVTEARHEIVPWARAYRQAQGESATLIYPLARTPERETQFVWIGELMPIRYHLFKLRARADIQLQNLDDARAWRISVVREDVRHQYLMRKRFPRLILATQSSDNIRHLMNGQADLIPYPAFEIEGQCERHGVDCRLIERTIALDELDTSLYLAASRGCGAALVEQLRRGFEELRAQGGLRRLEQLGRGS